MVCQICMLAFLRQRICAFSQREVLLLIMQIGHTHKQEIHFLWLSICLNYAGHSTT